MSKVTYGKQASGQPTELIPSPLVSIRTEADYSSENNDTLVGHKHIIVLNGYAISASGEAQVLGAVSDNIKKVRDALSVMGGDLIIKNDSDDIVIKAKGGKLTSLNFNNSNNNWKTYAPYIAEMEFQAIEYAERDNYSCSTTVLDSSASNNLVDISKYKIKSHQEEYSIDIGDNIYNRIRTIDSNEDLELENIYFTLTYNISAVGKNFYINNQLLPAWEQAKNFVQERLYKQVKNLCGDILGLDQSFNCSSTRTLSNIHATPADEGLLKDLHDKYKIYNETISCETSESQGSFSATYNCIIKRNADTVEYADPDTIHTITKNIQYSSDQSYNTTITINGNIQGLIEGGLLYADNGFFNLPENGKLITQGSGPENLKYTKALDTLDLMLNDTGEDIDDTLKTKLGITMDALRLDPSVFLDCTPPPHPKASSLNLTKTPFEGTISYSAVYSSNVNCGYDYSNVSISVQKPNKIFATFNLPSAITVGTILQDLGTTTAQSVSISIQGRSDDYKMCFDNFQNSVLSGLCDNFAVPTDLANKLPNENLFVLKTKNKTTNLMDGSYTINLEYICNSGCDLI
jgi:hypothetical protein